VARAALELLRRCALRNRSGVQHAHLVAHRERHAQVVSDQDQAPAARGLELPQAGEAFALGERIKRGRRFVGDQELGILSQGGGDTEP
jgi:hypothetical protein